MSRPPIHGLVPAAGAGRRFAGARPKQYCDLNGKPVLSHAMSALARHPSVVDLTVAVAADDVWYGELVRPTFPTAVVVRGGVTRAESVRAGLRAIRSRAGSGAWVVVHDAARPCLAQSDLESLLNEALDCPDGGLLAIPVRDTLKRGGLDQRCSATVARTGLWAALTPQLFPVDRLLAALDAELNAGHDPTDEAQAMERQGARPLLVRGSGMNLKITWPEDLELAESWLTARAARHGS